MNIEMKSKVESSEKVLASKLNFVDLAGSERVKNTGSTGIALKEATYINKSLTFLEQVVVALTDKTRRKDYIPYRQSKLTHILKDSIGGNCKTCMIATIWPEEPFILETLSTLNFAKRMKNVVNDISVNTIVDTNAYLKKLQREIKDLKQELLMHNTLANRGNINYDPYTPEEQYVQQQIALRFLNGENEDIDFDSIRQAKELFNQCRIIFQKEFTAENLLEDKNKNNVERKDTKNSIEKQKSISDAKSGVGEFIEKPSFGIGRAPKDARPVYSNEQPNNLNNTLRESQIINENAYVSYNDFVEEGGDKNINIQDNLQKKNLSNENADVILRNDNDDFEEEISEENIPDKNSAFALYKNENETAKNIEEQIIQTNTDLKAKKDEAKKLGEEGNKLKEQIDKIKTALNEKQQNKLNLADEMTNVIDDEECKLIDELKDVRSHYKDTVDKFKNVKVEINEMKNNLDMLKVKYVDSFENWFFKKYKVTIQEHELRLAKAKYGVNINEEVVKEKISDPDEEAFNNAKRKVQSIHRAKRMEKAIK